LITGTLTYRIRRREQMLRLREARTETLYDIVRTIVAANSRQEIARTVCDRLGANLNEACSVYLVKADGGLGTLEIPDSGEPNDDKESAVIKWVFENRKSAGWSTDTLPDAGALYLPLQGPTELVGVLAYRPKYKVRLLQEEQNLLSAVTRQLAVAVERDLFQERSHQSVRLQESERLHQTILDSVSHEIRTPLTAIIGMASALDDERVSENEALRAEMSHDLMETARRLNRVVNNLLDMSRLSTGVLSLNRDWHDIRDVISLATAGLAGILKEHNLQVKVPEDVPLVRIDLHLFEQVLSNLLLNAATYSPPGSTLTVEVALNGRQLVLSVADNGSGIPPDSLPHIFEKFYRVPGSQTGGTGLGLAVVKSIVETHGGTIQATNRAEGGLTITMSLPIEKRPGLPEESSE
jgi:two-component system, OmpR family, sensor histidine kinase KdpD